MAVAAADADIFIHHHKTVFTLVHRPARADFGAGRIFAVVTGNRQVIGKDVLMPDAVILLPVAAGVFVDAAEADVRGQVFVIFTGQFAGFATGATAESIKNPYWVVIGYSLHLFNLDKVCVRWVALRQRRRALRGQHVNAARLIDAVGIRVVPGPFPSATPGIMRGVTLASICTSPRSLKMRTRSPLAMPALSHPSG
jgi:hypothetical protein